MKMTATPLQSQAITPRVGYFRYLHRLAGSQSLGTIRKGFRPLTR